VTRSRRWVPWTIAAMSYAGFVVAAYLTIVHYRGYVSPCYVVHGCEEVQTSKYSVILGVPVALAGAGSAAVAVTARSAAVPIAPPMKRRRCCLFMGLLSLEQPPQLRCVQLTPSILRTEADLRKASSWTAGQEPANLPGSIQGELVVSEAAMSSTPGTLEGFGTNRG